MYLYLSSFYSSPLLYSTDFNVVYVNSPPTVSPAFLHSYPPPTSQIIASHNSSFLLPTPTVQNIVTPSLFPTEVAEQEEDITATMLTVFHAGESI